MYRTLVLQWATSKKLLILENETKYARKLSAKDTLIQYLINVLKDSDSLIKFWQTIIKTQAQEISKFEKYQIVLATLGVPLEV